MGIMRRGERESENCKLELDELRDSHQRLIDFIATGTDIIWEADADLRLVSGLQIVRKGNILDVESPASNTALMGSTVIEILGTNPICEPPLHIHLDDLYNRRPFRGFTCQIPLPDGTVMWTESNGNPFFTETGEFKGYRGTSRDITQRKRDAERIAFLAHHDALTRLPNRQLFRERLEQALVSAETEAKFALMLLDLDLFKTVNDTLGHPVGDLLLRAVSERLSSSLRDFDVVARLGGDEFAIIQTRTEGPEQVALLAQQLVEVIGQPYELDGHHVTVSATIGVALAPEDGTNADQLLINADIALYSAKAHEPGSWCFFESEMGIRLEARRALKIDIRNAISNNEFELGYRPVHNARSRNIGAFEAVPLWRRPMRGTLQLADFVPIAEETGMIMAIGDWVLHQACEEAAKWPDHIGLVVNLSPAQLRNRMLVATVGHALLASGCRANKLELQITEAALMQNGEAMIATLHQLRGLGTRISLDNFGTGQSSLLCVRDFPFDKIKIDRAFIHDLANDQGGNSIARAVASLGRHLGVLSSSEEVEKEQFIILQAEGCQEMQEYFFSPPVAAKDVPAMLDKPREIRAPGALRGAEYPIDEQQVASRLSRRS